MGAGMRGGTRRPCSCGERKADERGRCGFEDIRGQGAGGIIDPDTCAEEGY